jgi:hypothetical protein
VSDARPVPALDAPPPTAPVLATTLAQAFALFALWRASDGGALEDAPHWGLPLWSLALAVPTLYVLSAGIGPPRRLLVGLALWAGVLAATGTWVGHQLLPTDAFGTGGVVAAWTLTMLLATVGVHVALQAACAGAPRDYPTLVAAAWRANQVPVLALAFTGLFGAVLALWAGLFSLIGIDLFADVFTEQAFLFPALGLAFGVGVLLMRRLADRLGRYDAALRNLMVLLLPLSLAIAAAFVAALPFTGLAPLWETGHGTALLLALLLAILGFVNGVHQDATDPSPYPAAVDRALAWALLVGPVLAALAAWGLWLRVDQYGWTVQRFWAAFVCAVLAAHALGYAGAVLRRGRAWTRGLGPVNTTLGALVLVALVAVNTPLADPRRLAVDSQLARVEAGAIDVAALDFAYFHRALARPGHRAVERLRAEHADDPAVLAAIDLADPRRVPDASTRERLVDALRTRPADLELTDALRATLEETDFALRTPGERWLVRQDVDRDGDADYLLLQVQPGYAHGVALVDAGGTFTTVPLQAVADSAGAERIAATLASGPVRAVRPAYDAVVIGEGASALRIDLRAPLPGRAPAGAPVSPGTPAPATGPDSRSRSAAPD